jgi:hypothetical protein
VGDAAGTRLAEACYVTTGEKLLCTTKGHVDIKIWSHTFKNVKVGPWTKTMVCVEE